jgi:hypothetical protein
MITAHGSGAQTNAHVHAHTHALSYRNEHSDIQIVTDNVHDHLINERARAYFTQT